MRVRKTPYIADWEENRQGEIKELTGKGIVPVEHEIEKKGREIMKERPWLMGSVSSVINDVKPAKEIVDEMIQGAVEHLQRAASLVSVQEKARL